MSKARILDGYVVIVRYYATSENPNFFDGELRTEYCGANKTFLGMDDFKPYRTEEGALKGMLAWEKHYINRNASTRYWRYHVGGVARITKEMYDVIEGQYVSDMMICKAITIGDIDGAH